MKKVLLIGLAVVLFVAGTSSAFNGQRRGFVLGGGAGLAPVCKFEAGSYDESKAGVGFQFVIGGAFDEHNMLVYEGNIVGFDSDLFEDNAAQGFNGASWYHYFGRTGRSAFTTVGIGFEVMSVDDEYKDSGFGMLLGGGYEFARHWQVGLFIGFGKTTNPEFDHSHISILVSGIAF